MIDYRAYETRRNTALKPLENTKSIICGLYLVLLAFDTLS